MTRPPSPPTNGATTRAVTAAAGPSVGAVAPFEVVVRAQGQVVWRVCRALLAPADAEDAWAETFLAALRAYPDLAPDSNVRGWLATIAHRKALDQIRAARRRPEPRADPTLGARSATAHPAAAAPMPPPTQPGGPPHHGSVQALDQLEDDELRVRVAALPDKARRAVIYRYLADLPYAEVAALLGVSQAAARRNAADGIAALRRLPPPAPATTSGTSAVESPSKRHAPARLPLPTSGDQQ